MSATAMDTEGGAESVMMEKDTVDDRSINLHPVSFPFSLSRPSCLHLISSAFPQGRDRRPPHYQRTLAGTTAYTHSLEHARLQPLFAGMSSISRYSVLFARAVAYPITHTHTHNTTAFILFSPRPHIHLTCASLLFSPRPARDHQYL